MEESNEMRSTDQALSDWDGPEDRDNPQRWDSMKKLCHIVPVGAIVLAVTMGSSIISPAAQQIEDEFGVSREAAVLPFVSRPYHAVRTRCNR